MQAERQRELMLRSRRAMSWLRPGLVVKRWLLTSGIGLVLALLGAAVWADLQPIYWMLWVIQEALGWITRVLPGAITGPLVLLLGIGLLLWGQSQSFGSIQQALAPEKDTVLRLLAGLQLPTAGELRLFDEPQPYLRLDQRRPPDVRLVFQNPALLASLTVEENVGFLLNRLGRMEPAQVRDRVMACLDAVGLYEVAALYPGQLSGGMQKRVSFARALIDDPDRDEEAMPLLLYDEPTAGLDPTRSPRSQNIVPAKATTAAITEKPTIPSRTLLRIIQCSAGCIGPRRLPVLN